MTHSLPFLTGLLGSGILVVGAALPDTNARSAWESGKNRCFAAGTACMFLFSILNYFHGAPVFFVFFEVLMVVSSILMMCDVDHKLSVMVTTSITAALIAWSLLLAHGIDVFIFILGLGGIAAGFVLPMGTFRRAVSLTLGSILIALFSYLTASWIFFWLNVFFAVFSAYYAYVTAKNESARKQRVKIFLGR